MNSTLGGILLILSAVSPSRPALSVDGSSVDFRFGDDCERLDDQPLDVLIALIVGADDQERGAFCTVTGDGDCGDFSRTLQEFGSLVPSHDAGVCRFAPRPLLREQE